MNTVKVNIQNMFPLLYSLIYDRYDSLLNITEAGVSVQNVCFLFPVSVN